MPMKQLVQNLRTGETSVAVVPLPTPKPGTALVRTSASLVSAGTERMLVEFAGKSLLAKARSRPDLLRQLVDKARREGPLTTLEAAFNRLDQPMPLGYSSAGTIVAVGPQLHGFQVGDRVACAGGGYAVHAEYALVPRNLMAVLPEDVDFESAAFTTLGAIALHGFRLAQPQIGERVGVIGLGLLGLLTAAIASAAGCRVLGIDINPQRVELAARMGAHLAVLRPEAEEAALSFSRGRGLDVVLICADTPSNDPVVLAAQIARDRARVVAVGAVGLSLPRKLYYEKELTFINSRSYGPGRYDTRYEEKGQDYPLGYVRWTEGRNLEAVVDLLAAGRLDVKALITHRFPIDQAPQAYDLITGRSGKPFLGVLLTYPVPTRPESPPKSAHQQPGVPATQLPTPKGQDMPVERVKLGVLGAGNFASAVMLPSLSRVSGIDLLGIASASGLSAAHAARKFGFAYAADRQEQVLSDPEVNTIAIVTRHNLHASLVVSALQAGKHVFCEKPLAIRPDELDEIVRLLRAPETPLLTVGFNRRFAALAKQLHAFLQPRREPLFAHYRVNAGYLPPDHWLHDPEQGGGRIIGEACHFVDFLTFLVGEPPVTVSTQALPDGGQYLKDNVHLTLTYPDGSLGTLSYLANGDKAFPKERVEVFSAGRVAVLDDYRTLETVKDGRRQVRRSRLRQDKGHQAEWLALKDALTGSGQPPIPYDHLLGVTQACFAAVESLQTGTPVPVTRLAV